MQTFLPFTSFIASATILDSKRLNKQIVEAYQILTGRVPNLNHPACIMWQGRKLELFLYLNACFKEHKRRMGKPHACESKPRKWDKDIDCADFRKVSWDIDFGYLFHLSHRVNLLRKDATHYAFLWEYMPVAQKNLDAYPTGYYWPVDPVGKKAKADRAAWLEWGKKNRVEG